MSEWHSNLTINASISGGTDISRACDELVSLSQRAGVWVRADFNGVTLLASPDTDRERLADRWHEEMGSNRPHKIASARAPK